MVSLVVLRGEETENAFGNASVVFEILVSACEVKHGFGFFRETCDFHVTLSLSQNRCAFDELFGDAVMNVIHVFEIDNEFMVIGFLHRVDDSFNLIHLHDRNFAEEVKDRYIVDFG
jgi:hypothetical protein